MTHNEQVKSSRGRQLVEQIISNVSIGLLAQLAVAAAASAIFVVILGLYYYPTITLIIMGLVWAWTIGWVIKEERLK